MIDVYESATDQTGRLGAVFECDGDTAYFYLLELNGPDRLGIVEAFNIGRARDLSARTPIAVRWSSANDAAGLLIEGELIALFDLKNQGEKGRWAERGDRDRFTVN